MDRLDKEKLWQRCQSFHGHVCGGLLTGFLASLYASELLDLGISKDEEIVCISENDTCAVDAVQVVLGCTVGKGNLLFHMTGKLAFSFYSRETGKSVRLGGKQTACALRRVIPEKSAVGKRAGDAPDKKIVINALRGIEAPDACAELGVRGISAARKKTSVGRVDRNGRAAFRTAFDTFHGAGKNPRMTPQQGFLAPFPEIQRSFTHTKHLSGCLSTIS